jgi:hypothetical protein
MVKARRRGRMTRMVRSGGETDHCVSGGVAPRLPHEYPFSRATAALYIDDARETCRVPAAAQRRYS